MTKVKVRRRPLPPLEDRFEFLGGSPVRGEPLRAVRHEVLDRTTGLERSLKLWRKTGDPAGDDDLRQLWLREMRQVQRLMHHGGAAEVIVDVVEPVEDEDEFGILVEHAGQPLSERRLRAHRQHWLKNLEVPRSRRILWRNVGRLVRALGIIHSQGLVHGRISMGSVMTEGSDEPDFKLTGFEWSLRLGGEGSGTVTPATVDRYSFEDDWGALGRLVADCLDHAMSPSGEARPKGGQTAPPHLGVDEVSFLRTLTHPKRSDNLDATTLLQSVERIVAEVGRDVASSAGTLVLLFAAGARLSDAVYDATEGLIAADDHRARLDWVTADLDGGARLVVPRRFDPSEGGVRLVTNNMVYELGPRREDDGTPKWDVAVCRRARRRSADVMIPEGEDRSLSRPVEIASSPTGAAQARGRLGPDALDWLAYARVATATPTQGPATAVRQALALIQVVEALVRAFEAYPVEVLDLVVSDGRRSAVLRGRPANDRDGFAAKLGLADTPTSLGRLFADARRDAGGNWCLSRSGGLGAGRRDDIPVAFDRTGDHQGRHAYWFDVDEEPSGGAWFLRLERDAGTEGQIRRRLKVIRAMDGRVDLAEMLADPWRVRRSSRDAPPGGDDDVAFGDLDESKQEALTALWGTLPGYHVVGPPGVGKTFLVTEVVRRRFDAERSSRILVTAQAHDALDHLQGELGGALTKAGHADLLVVRSTAQDRAEGKEGVRRTGAALLGGLLDSPILADAPGPLRERVGDLARAAARPGVTDVGATREVGASLGALHSLILDSANVVVSTANSPDLARLVDAREQFDWVIVEEAAKATGPELVAPLMLSGRRLMIGDHHQLPPFDADRLGRVLGDHGILTQAIELADRHLGQLVRDGEIGELRALAEDPPKLREVGDLARRLLEPFRTFVVEDASRADTNPAHRRISSQLAEQRRMDPALAEIVSTVFYKGGLGTTDKRREKARLEPAPFETRAPLTRSPLLVVDFAHVSSTGSARAMERDGPHFHNPAEVDAVIDVLRLLRPRPGTEKAPTLVVLSFYNGQVEKLIERIEAEEGAGRLGNLAGFARAAAGWVSTVDGFQGNEADLVILSLVRNNAKTGSPALGFLRDRRRMNVALSRARWQLVLVGSLHFLREAANRGRARDGGDDLAFLTELCDVIEGMKARTAQNGEREATILPVATLGSGGGAC